LDEAAVQALIDSSIASKAPIANPTFTGNVVVPDADAATEAMNRQTSDARFPIGASEKGNLRFVIDGGGSVITTGAKKAYLTVPYAGTITSWTILGDASGAIVLDVWKDTYANFPPVVGDSITASAKPTVTASATKATSSTLTGWTTSVAAGDVLEVNVDSVATFTKVTLDLAVTRTS
jgi:hypothetical protein